MTSLETFPSPPHVLDTLSLYIALEHFSGLTEQTLNAIVCLTCKKTGLPYMQQGFRAQYIRLEDALIDYEKEELTPEKLASIVTTVYCPQMDEDIATLQRQGLIEKHWRQGTWHCTDKWYTGDAWNPSSDERIVALESRGILFKDFSKILRETIQALHTEGTFAWRKPTEHILEEAYKEYLKQYTRPVRKIA